MGLAEQIRGGANLDRTNISFVTDVSGVGSVDLGATYALLKIQTSIPCRLRLYDSQASRDNEGEIVRPFGVTDISASVALVGDFSMSTANVTYTTDPILYGLTSNAENKLTYYRVTEAVSAPTIQVTRYLLEDRAVSAQIGGQYSTENRRTLPQIKVGPLEPNVISASGAGVLSDTSIPQTFLFVSASIVGATNIARIRLYNSSASLNSVTEASRSFSVEASASAGLIADIIISGSETTYFTPKIIGGNFNNVGTDLILAQLDQGKMLGDNALYYRVENKSTTAQPITASFHVYSLED